MSVNLTALTELEAVNVMLATIGEAPLSTLENSMHSDAIMARQTLAMVSREVQSEGWWYNTDNDYPLTPDTEGHINLPETIISVDIAPSENAYTMLDIVQRGNRLYDRKNHTYNFENGFGATVLLLLPFEELPECVRQYIAVRAARRFQGEAVGSDTLYRFTEANEYAARVSIMREQIKNSDSNFLSRGRNSTFGYKSIGRITDRRFV